MKKYSAKNLLALLLTAALLAVPMAGVAEELKIEAVDCEGTEVPEADGGLLYDAKGSDTAESGMLADELETAGTESATNAFEPTGVSGQADDNVMAPNAGDVNINTKNFPDKWFRGLIRDAFDENGDKKLSGAEITEVQDVSLWIDKDCANMKGIEFFYNLRLLEIEGYLKELDVSKNKKLVELICHHVGLTELNISGNTQLKQLIVSGNKLKSIDIGNCPELISTVQNYSYYVYNGIAYWENNEYPFAIEIDANTVLTAGDKVLYNPKSTIVKLSASSVTLGVKDTFALSPVVTPSSQAKNLRFKTSNKKIAAVDAKTGKITAKKKGTATISATLNGKTLATCKVTVKNAPGKVTLNKKKVTINAGNTFQLKAKLPSGTYTSKYTWTSNKNSVATVDKNGLVTGIRKGTAKITVKTGNGKKATCTVTVKAAKPSGKELSGYLGKNIHDAAKAIGGLKYSKWDEISIVYDMYENDVIGLFGWGYVDTIELKAKSDYSLFGIRIGMDRNTVRQIMKGYSAKWSDDTISQDYVIKKDLVLRVGYNEEGFVDFVVNSYEYDE